jgi:mannose-6-phosphate isomerase
MSEPDAAEAVRAERDLRSSWLDQWHSGAVTLGPLLLVPRLVEKPWGGRRLADLGRDLPDGALVGESWDVADLDATVTDVPDPVSRVAVGPYAGSTLTELIAQHGEALLGRTAPTAAGRFPLLVKHLDARENLSVQVHPSPAVLDRLPGANLKTESWVVVHAEPGAELMLGVTDGVTPEDFEAAFGTTDVVPMIRRVPARVGDVHHVPAGLLHALGAGVVVAEPQTPSDTTYRLYDWTQEYGRAPRELHREQAMQCLGAEWDVNLHPPVPVGGDGLLVETEHYTIARHTAPLEGHTHVPQRLTARVVVVVTGEMRHHDLPPLGPGGVVLLPAAWGGTFELVEGTTWLDLDLV